MSFNSDMTNLADSIRAKTNITEPLTVKEMAAAVESITGGGGSEVAYGVIDAEGKFQALDLTGEAPELAGEPAELSGLGVYELPESEPEEPELPGVPLTLTNMSEAEYGVELVVVQGADDPPLDVSGFTYRIGTSGEFIPFTPGQMTFMVQPEESIQFMGPVGGIDQTYESYLQFRFTSGSQFYASGSVMSLVGFADTLKPYAFYSLFAGCAILSAPELPATTLAKSCYAYMFYECKFLTEAPELPALEVPDGGYSHMFEGCTHLVTPPELPATQLGKYCYNSIFFNCVKLELGDITLPATHVPETAYQSMFYNCRKLTGANLLGQDLEGHCYRGMFELCSNLTKISVAHTTWGMILEDVFRDATYTFGWVDDVSATGTFTKPAKLPDTRGPSAIPEGWTVVNK